MFINSMVRFETVLDVDGLMSERWLRGAVRKPKAHAQLTGTKRPEVP